MVIFLNKAPAFFESKFSLLQAACVARSIESSSLVLSHKKCCATSLSLEEPHFHQNLTHPPYVKKRLNKYLILSESSLFELQIVYLRDVHFNLLA